MPVARIPLVGSFNQRTIDAATALTTEDQRFLNCTFSVVNNQATGKRTVYAEKRPGWGVDSTVSSGIASTGLIQPQAFSSPFSAFGTTNSAVYVGSVNVGTITGRALHFTETLIAASSYVLLKSSDGTGWYYPNGAKDITAYTGHTSSGTTTVSTLSSVSGLYPGQLVTGNTIGASARISTVTASTSSVTLTVASTSTSTATALTKEPIAKILSAQFVSSTTFQSAFVAIDGYHVYATDDGNIRNSDLNSITAYTASNFVQPDMSPDPPVALGLHKNMVVAWGTGSMEVFHNAGNAAGSPFTRIPQLFSRFGAVDQRGVSQLGDDLYYVTGARFGDVAVMRLRNLQPQPVSTQTIDKILGTLTASGGQIYLSGFQLGGYNYVGVTALNTSEATSFLQLESGDDILLESADKAVLDDSASQTAMFGRMFVYNTDLNLWIEWDSSEATYIVGVGAGQTNKLLATSRVDTTGAIYTINPASSGELHTDNGVAFTMEIRTSKLDFGTDRRKAINSIRLIADTQASGTASLECSDDDYASWTTLGTFDMTQQVKRITRCGAYRGGRAYRLRHSANTAFRGEALEFDYAVGSA
jgi:hypothetical protein